MLIHLMKGTVMYDFSLIMEYRFKYILVFIIFTCFHLITVHV